MNFSLVIFGIALLGTFGVALRGRQDASHIQSGALSEQRLNKWLVGLSAGATANSGFVVTAAVGLGYTLGIRWLLLPLSWLLGDIVFWTFFPQKINAIGREVGAGTMTDVIVNGLARRPKVWLRRAIGLLITACLGGYVSAQWLAGQKFLRGAFGFQGVVSLIIFAAMIVVYTAIGGFRGSVYADSMQAVIRLLGTAIAGIVLAIVATRNPSSFWSNVAAAGPGFTNFFPSGGVGATIAFVVGFASASIGFGLGQPQMVTRYLAGASPQETRSAWWIYNGFVQFTWLSMTLFGVALRGVMPDLTDPEMGLSLFFRAKTGPVLSGLIAADIFATIAATSNSLLVTMSQTATRDLLGKDAPSSDRNLWPLTTLIGIATMLISLRLHNSVVDMALEAVRDL